MDMLPAIADLNFSPVSAALAFLSFTLACIVYRNSRKRLKAHVLNTIRLLPTDREEWKLFKVTHNDKPVENVFITFARVKNCGRVPVERTDFDEPLEFHFNPGCEVLSASAIYGNPEKILEIPVSTRRNLEGIESASIVRVEPHLFNGGDELGLRFVVSNFVTCVPQAHIKGVRSIHPGAYDLDLAGLFRPRKKRWYDKFRD